MLPRDPLETSPWLIGCWAVFQVLLQEMVHMFKGTYLARLTIFALSLIISFTLIRWGFLRETIGEGTPEQMYTDRIQIYVLTRTVWLCGGCTESTERQLTHFCSLSQFSSCGGSYRQLTINLNSRTCGCLNVFHLFPCTFESMMSSPRNAPGDRKHRPGSVWNRIEFTSVLFFHGRWTNLLGKTKISEGFSFILLRDLQSKKVFQSDAQICKKSSNFETPVFSVQRVWGMRWGGRWSCRWGRESNWRSKETRRRTESWWVNSCCFQDISSLRGK